MYMPKTVKIIVTEVENSYYGKQFNDFLSKYPNAIVDVWYYEPFGNGSIEISIPLDHPWMVENDQPEFYWKLTIGQWADVD
jgi:hypothetical protein